MISMAFSPLLILFFLLLVIKTVSKQRRKLPPGPRSWPIVGNLLQLGNKPHVLLAQMAQTYGPLISVRLGMRLLVVASSPSAADSILKFHDRLLSARDIPHTYRVRHYISHSLVFSSECNERWKALRTVCKTELFAARLLDAQAHVREKKVSEAIGFLFKKKGEEVKIGELAFETVFNIIGNAVFSRDVFQLGSNENSASGLKNHISRILQLGMAPNLADFYPFLGCLDIQGLTREATAFVDRVYGIWDGFVQERRELGDGKKDFLEVLLCAGYEDLTLKALITDLFVAGTETTTMLTEWTMSELARNPKAMRKVRDELEMVVGKQRNGENAVKESHLIHLDYLHACIKETLRLHPPVPLLIPRQSVEECELLNYTIPKDSRVIVNVWAMGRDPKIWNDPLEFLPERFLHSNVDYKGNCLEFIPFGAGRRICPGLPLAARVVELILASLIHTFHWSLPDGMQPDDINMEERFGLTLGREHPLVLIPKTEA